MLCFQCGLFDDNFKVMGSNYLKQLSLVYIVMKTNLNFIVSVSLFIILSCLPSNFGPNTPNFRLLLISQIDTLNIGVVVYEIYII